ncbi:F-box/LRR-repeat protein 12 isoform X2 [Vidua macroura]|uniref:F-box/LRR-repeat protein 12 isoform X2 n=1 Tax=Vidua macroura TaxID=187451 RepID=UPI0023A8F8DF|nr:F-box/LRR-repeat protein 12 isoform X2 [Vidua macroura]
MAARPPLPDSVLVQVLALLPLRDRLRAARVCRRWQQLAQDRAVWTHVDLSPHRISRRTLWHLVRHRLPDSLCTLRMRGVPRSGGKQRLLSPALLAALRKRCPQLHRLCLTETDLRHVPYESMPASVTTLELSLCDIPDAWFCVSPSVPPPQVQHLAIHSIPTFSDHHLLDISSQSHLKTLSLCGTYRVTDMGIQAAAPHLEELERLILRHCIIGDTAMVFIGRHMKQLRYLEISNAYFLTNRGLVAIVTLEHLETLCLDLYDLVSLGTVIALLQVLPRLNHLKLGGICFEDELLNLQVTVRLVMRIPEHLIPRARHPVCPRHCWGCCYLWVLLASLPCDKSIPQETEWDN